MKAGVGPVVKQLQMCCCTHGDNDQHPPKLTTWSDTSLHLQMPKPSMTGTQKKGCQFNHGLALIQVEKVSDD